MTTKTRKREAENARWHEQHTATRAAATRAAEQQRQVAEGRQLLDGGLRTVHMPSIADAMDRADPHTSRFYPDERPRVVVVTPTAREPLSPTQEENDMETATFISGTRVKPVASKYGGAKKATVRLSIPPDIAEKLPAGIEFDVELTEAGLLFRPTGMRTVQLPAWAQNGNGNGHVAKR